MTKLLVPALACLASMATAIIPSSVQLAPFPTSTDGYTAATAHPLMSTRTVPNGPHPTYSWPPASSTSASACTPIQYAFPEGNNANTSRADAVRDLYRASWSQYAQYCFGKDTLLPLNNSCDNDLFGWGASIVDGIDTAIIMNLTDIVDQQLKWISQVDFTRSDYLVDGFDAIIRYLGGLLSAYDLLTSDYVPKGTYDQNLIDAVLTQAQTLGDKLKPQFDNPSGLPAAQINFTTNQIINSMFTDPLNNVTYNDSNVAVAGTIILEFYRLADLTGDQSFKQLVSNSAELLAVATVDMVNRPIVLSQTWSTRILHQLSRIWLVRKSTWRLETFSPLTTAGRRVSTVSWRYVSMSKWSDFSC